MGMKKHLSHFLLLLEVGMMLFATEGYAQTSVLKQVEVYTRPAIYINPKSDAPFEKHPKTSPHSLENLWVVHSDRDDNLAYSGPSTDEKVISNLDFMQPALVIGENENWLQLVEYKTTWCLGSENRYKKLCGSIRVLGWVEKKNLLLWEAPLHTPNNTVIKALAVSTVDDLREMIASENPSLGAQKRLSLYNDPQLQKKNKSDFRIFNFLFVYKMENNNLLVGKDHSIVSHRESADRSILGWVDTRSVEQWKFRICLEPTAEQYTERKNGGWYNALFGDESGAQQYSLDGSMPTEPVWKKLLSVRPAPGIKRLPILDKKPGHHGATLVHTGVVTPIYNSQGSEVWSEEAFTEVSLSKEERDAENSKVNLIFVVEDSRQMGPYLPKVRELILETGQRLEQKRKNLNMLDKPFEFSMGFVLYRQDNADACGDKSVEPYTPQPDDYQKVADAFTNKCHQFSCGTSRTYSMLRALDEALNFVKNKPWQNNLIVVLGTGSNAAVDFSNRKTGLINKLDTSNACLLIFQPKNLGTDDFFDQIKSIQLGAMRKELEFEARKWSRPQVEEPKLIPDPDVENMFALNCPEESPLPGVIMFADKNVPMDEEKLKLILSDMVEKSQQVKERISDEADAFVRGQGVRPPLNAGMRHYLATMNIDVENLQKLDYTNFQLFVKGWTSTNAGKPSQKLYRYVVFLTGQEFANYLDILAKLNSKSSTDEQLRQNMKSQFESLAKTYAGARESKNSSITIADVFKYLTDIPSLSQGYNIEISRISSLSAEDFDRLKGNLQKKYEGLKRYYDNKDNSYSLDGLTYYWVPVEYF
jgi:hypothetical protein